MYISNHPLQPLYKSGLPFAPKKLKKGFHAMKQTTIKKNVMLIACLLHVMKNEISKINTCIYKTILDNQSVIDQSRATMPVIVRNIETIIPRKPDVYHGCEKPILTGIDTPAHENYLRLSKRNQLSEKTELSCYDDPDDHLQDSYLRVLENGADPAFLPAMAKQCRLNSLKSQGIRSHSDIDDYSEIIGGHAHDDSLMSHILSYLYKNEQKQIFSLYFIEGLTTREICKNIGLSEGDLTRQLKEINNIISSLNLKSLVDYRHDRPGAETIKGEHWNCAHPDHWAIWDTLHSEITVMDNEDLESFVPHARPALSCRWINGQKKYRETWEWVAMEGGSI